MRLDPLPVDEVRKLVGGRCCYAHGSNAFREISCQSALPRFSPVLSNIPGVLGTENLRHNGLGGPRLQPCRLGPRITRASVPEGQHSLPRPRVESAFVRSVKLIVPPRSSCRKLRLSPILVRRVLLAFDRS